MATAFKQFSEAARLYATYSATVDEMWELLKADIALFHEALKTHVQGIVAPLRIQEERGEATRSWWLAEKDLEESDDANDRTPYIYLQNKSVETVVPGQLRVSVHCEHSDEELRRKIAVVQSQLVLPAHCENEKTGKFFVITIEYGDADPIKACAEPVAILLRSLAEIDI